MIPRGARMDKPGSLRISPEGHGEHKIHGVAVSELTDIGDRNQRSLTPHRKRAQIALEPAGD